MPSPCRHAASPAARGSALGRRRGTPPPLVAETRPDVVAPRDEPAVALGLVEDARSLAQPVERRVGVGEQSGIRRVERERLARLHRRNLPLRSETHLTAGGRSRLSLW